MNDAACSWRTSTYRIGERAKASVKPMFSSPGIPNTTVTPSRSRQRTSRSATPSCSAITRAYRRTHSAWQGLSRAAGARAVTSPSGPAGAHRAAGYRRRGQGKGAMPAGVIAGERIRALAGDGVPGVVCWWPGRRACGLPGRPGLPMSPVRCRPGRPWCARGFRDEDRDRDGRSAAGRAPGARSGRAGFRAHPGSAAGARQNPAGAPALAAVLPRSLPSAGIPGRHWSAAVAASPAGAVASRSNAT